MLLTLDREQMSRLWLQLTRLEPLRTDCVVTRTYGIDIEALAAREMRLWYVSLMRRGPLRWLKVSEMADEASLTVSDDGITSLQLPKDCVRPVSVTLHGWERPAVIVTPDSPLARLQTNPFSRGGVARAVAVLNPDGKLEVYSPPATGQARLRSFLGVRDPGENSYIFDDEALTTVTPLDGRPPLSFKFPDN